MITIPGLKVLDEIIAGLPTNSAQRLELAKLRSEIEVKDGKIKELEAKLAALEPKHGMDTDTVRVLKVFFEEDRDLSAEEISAILDMKKSVVSYHIDELRRMKFAMPSRAITSHSPATYVIYPEGRAFLIKHKIA